jgi:hypothetical protein
MFELLSFRKWHIINHAFAMVWCMSPPGTLSARLSSGRGASASCHKELAGMFPVLGTLFEKMRNLVDLASCQASQENHVKHIGGNFIICNADTRVSKRLEAIGTREVGFAKLCDSVGAWMNELAKVLLQLDRNRD